jgi:hypothetical protein
MILNELTEEEAWSAVCIDNDLKINQPQASFEI